MQSIIVISLLSSLLLLGCGSTGGGWLVVEKNNTRVYCTNKLYMCGSSSLMSGGNFVKAEGIITSKDAQLEGINRTISSDRFPTLGLSIRMLFLSSFKILLDMPGSSDWVELQGKKFRGKYLEPDEYDKQVTEWRSKVGPGEPRITVHVYDYKPKRFEPDRVGDSLFRIAELQTTKHPEIVKRVKPKYPLIAFLAGITGQVSVRVVVKKDGVPAHAVIQRTDSDILNQAALEAAKQFQFEPHLEDKPVLATIEIKFDEANAITEPDK